MGRIVVHFAGPWETAPAFETELETHFAPGRDDELADELVRQGQRAEAIDGPEVSAIQRHRGVLSAACEFSKPGDREWARRAAQLVADAFAGGAAAAWVETADKVLGPRAAKDLDPRHPVTLFHLFVEVWGARGEVCTEGMQAFDLPDVAVRYEGDPAPAQAAAFGLAARMACDGRMPMEGDTYRASLSAPMYVVAKRAAEAPEDDDDLVNPRGAWVLTRL